MSRAAARKPKEAASPSEASPAERLSFTVDPSTGKIDRIEAVDAAGVRRDLGPEDRARLQQTRSVRSLQQIVEEAFLAGLEYALGDEENGPSEPPSAAEHQLLLPLIEHSAARRLMRPDVLRQAAALDLIRSAASARPARPSNPGGIP
jgi:hypothetical protein